MSEQPHYDFTPLTEEEVWRANNMGEMWDRAEAGEPIPALLRERMRAAEKTLLAKLQPQVEAWFMEGSGSHPDGLAALLPPVSEGEP